MNEIPCHVMCSPAHLPKPVWAGERSGEGACVGQPIDRAVRLRPCVRGHHIMKLPAGSRPYPCDSLSSLNPNSPTSSIGSIPDLEPVEDIPLPGETSTIGSAHITFTPLDPSDETQVIDSAISLLAFLIRQESPADRSATLNRVLREIEDKVQGGR